MLCSWKQQEEHETLPVSSPPESMAVEWHGQVPDNTVMLSRSWWGYYHKEGLGVWTSAPEQTLCCFTIPIFHSEWEKDSHKRLQAVGQQTGGQTWFLWPDTRFSLNYTGLEAHIGAMFSLLKGDHKGLIVCYFSASPDKYHCNGLGCYWCRWTDYIGIILARWTI